MNNKMGLSRLIILSCLAGCHVTIMAQTVKGNNVKPEDREVDMDNPTFVPQYMMGIPYSMYRQTTYMSFHSLNSRMLRKGKPTTDLYIM